MIMVAVWLCSCSSTKFVPENKYLVDKASINIIDNDSYKGTDLYNYLRQVPNHSVLGGLKLQLGVYNLSGRDSTKRVNRWLRSMGEPPVIYNDALTEASKKELSRYFVNKGFLGVNITADTIVNKDKRKLKVVYNVTTGEQHKIKSIKYDIDGSDLATLILADTVGCKLKPNTALDRNVMSEYRDNITRMLRERGYYAFNK